MSAAHATHAAQTNVATPVSSSLLLALKARSSWDSLQSAFFSLHGNQADGSHKTGPRLNPPT